MLINILIRVDFIFKFIYRGIECKTNFIDYGSIWNYKGVL